VTNPQLNEFGLHGTWQVNDQAATAVSRGASIAAGFQAAHVYLVLTSSGNTPRSVRVLLDGRPISSRAAGADVHGAR